MSKCKYYNGKCDYARKDSFTCAKNGGGSYCGKYRMLQNEEFLRDEIYE